MDAEQTVSRIAKRLEGAVKQKLLSVVTISFNQRDYVSQTLDSVISQKVEDVEYIVVDPGSTDGSRDILKRYASDIDVLILDPDEGPADGLNKGFAQATGRVGYFLNSDDYLLPGAIERMQHCWSHGSSADVVLGGGWMLSGEGQPIQPLRATRTDLVRLLDGRASLFQQGMSFSMEAFQNAGGFNPQNRTCWDLELLLDILAQGGRAEIVADEFGVFRMHGSSLSGGVAGAAHVQRYHADLARLRGKYYDAAKRCRGPLASRCLRLLENPSIIVDKLVARVLPGALQRHWRRASSEH